MKTRLLATLVLLVLVLSFVACDKDSGDPEALYGQIEPNMSIEDVYAIMEGYKPLTESESVANTPLFENGILQSKDLSKM